MPSQILQSSERLNHRYGVVHFGRRDRYQVAVALAEAGALERLFTDFYTPGWLLTLLQQVAPALAQRFGARHDAGLDDRYTTSLLLQYLWITRWRAHRRRPEQVDQAAADMGSEHAARFVARHPQVGMISYSYYWKALALARASGRWNGPAIVFQVHPVAQQIARILDADRAQTGLTYSPEAEEVISAEDTAEYTASLQYADGIVAASDFTARGLIELGIPSHKIAVIPYGAAQEVSPTMQETAGDGRWLSRRLPLRLLWVGQLSYRKGPHHLFAALRHFSPEQVNLTLVTKSSVPAELRELMPPHVTILDSVSDVERERLYRTHHLFVLPSMVEGFGLVYLEALAAGLPILCTLNTGGADLISDGVEGFVVESGSSIAIAEIIELCLKDPDTLIRMSAAARRVAALWTWPTFRANLRRSLAKLERTGTFQGTLTGQGQ